MSGITLRIDKGNSSTFHEIMKLLCCFRNIKECKRHFSVKISDEDLAMHQNEFVKIVELLPALQEDEFFQIPEYGTSEWADWMIDLYVKNRQKNAKK